MCPAWFKEERRVDPDTHETLNLVHENLRLVAERVDDNKNAVEEIRHDTSELKYALRSACEKLDTHEAASHEILENFKFAKRLRQVMVAVFGGVLLLLTLTHTGLEIMKTFGHWLNGGIK